MQYARISPRKPRNGLFLFRYRFIPPRHGKRRRRQNKGLVFLDYEKKGRKETFLIRFRGAMPGTFLLSGEFPGRAFHPEEIGRNRQKCRKPPKNADQEGGVNVKRTPGRPPAGVPFQWQGLIVPIHCAPLTPKTPRKQRTLEIYGHF